MATQSYEERLVRVALRPLTTSSRAYWAVVLLLAAVVGFGVFAYVRQLDQGLVVTGMRDQVMWGLYLVNFVFFIGISHAGTLISAILRVTHAGWRTPVTRMAEVITVVALMVGGVAPLIDMGRPDRVLNLILHGRFQSPLVWDIVAIATYLTGSLIYLYLPMIPDLALMRDRLGPTASTMRRRIYTTLAVGWRGTDTQKRRLERVIAIMAVVIIPIAISVHTVVSWIFAMTLRPGWDSTIFGPYFVVGAIFSGIASIIIVMAIFRRVFHLEEYLTEKHFRYLGILLGALLLIYAYFTVSEYLTVGYKLKVEEKHLLELLLVGEQAPWFWGFVITGILLPGALILNPRTRNIRGLVVASILVNISMWVKRWVVVVPSLKVPLMPYEFGSYYPTWVEWGITAGSFALFMLLFALFAKLFPVLSIHEMVEDEHARGARHVVEEVPPQVQGIPSPFTRERSMR